VQRDVAVGVHLADRGPEPERRADLHDRVGGETEELAFAHAGAGEQLDGEPVEGVGQCAGCGEHLPE